MSTTTGTKLLTADEYYYLPAPPPGFKHELVRGEVFLMAQPGWEHGEVQGNVVAAIKVFLRTNKIGRVAVESGVVTEVGPDTVRGPDVTYYSKERMPLDQRVVKYHDQSPDLCVEIVSPSNTPKELATKLKEYFFSGVRQVWVVTPEDRSIAVYRDPTDRTVLQSVDTLDGGDVLPGFSCKVADLFN